MARKNKKSDGSGISLHGRVYWLAYTYEGQQYKVNLHTAVFEDAVVAARKIRNSPPPGSQPVGLWDKCIKLYCKEKQDPRKARPDHLAGRPIKMFRPATAEKTANLLKTFAKWSGVDSPSKIKRKHLTDYYEYTRSHRPLSKEEKVRYGKEAWHPKKIIEVPEKGLCWKGSEASARTKIRTIQAFLDHIRCLPGRVTYALDAKPEVRDVTVSWDDYQALIAAATDPAMKFILFAGFHAGMRAGEITHCRPEWINLKTRILSIPQSEIQKLPSGLVHEWRIKDNEGRKIPLDEEFCEFLRGYEGMSKPFCLMGKRLSKTGLYDWGSSFATFMKNHDHPEVFPHAMRHSWISHLCNSGNHAISDVVAWSGDSVETIEKHYWKKQVVTGATDETMRGIRKSQTLAKIADHLRHIDIAGLAAKEREALQTLIDAAEDSPEKAKWSANAPVGHARIYSVGDTVQKPGIFRLLVEHEDVEPEERLSREEWEREWVDGRFATIRSRMDLLRRLGYIE